MAVYYPPFREEARSQRLGEVSGPPEDASETDDTDDWERSWQEWSRVRWTSDRMKLVDHQREDHFTYDGQQKVLRKLQHAHRKATKAVEAWKNDNYRRYRKSRAKDLYVDWKTIDTGELFSILEDITPRDFCGALAVLGSKDLEAYLQALSLPVHDGARDARGCLGPKHQDVFRNARSMPMSFRIGTIDGCFPPTIHTFMTAEDHAAKIVNGSHWDEGLWTRVDTFIQRGLSFRKGKKPVSFDYTTARRLFVGTTLLDECYMMIMLADSKHTAFDAVIPCTLVTASWQKHKSLFYRHRVLDILLITNLLLVAHKLRNRSAGCTTSVADFFKDPSVCNFPNGIIGGVILGIGVRNLMIELVKVFGFIILFGLTTGVGKLCHRMTLISFVVEIYVSSVVITFSVVYFLQATAEESSDLISNNADWVGVGLGMKLVNFTLSLLCTNMVGEAAMPAFQAMFSSESMWFLMFLFLFYFSTLATYYTIPIEENTGSTDALWYMFMKIFRLDFLGDFDLLELAGLDDELGGARVNLTTGVLTGTIDRPHINERRWKIVRFLNIFLIISSLVFSVMLMNVYIGIVGEAYQRQRKLAKRKVLRSKAQFVAAILQQNYVLTCGGRICDELADDGDHPGKWVLWDYDCVKAEEDESSQIDNIEEVVTDLHEKLEAIEKKSDDKLDQMGQKLDMILQRMGGGSMTVPVGDGRTLFR